MFNFLKKLFKPKAYEIECFGNLKGTASTQEKVCCKNCAHALYPENDYSNLCDAKYAIEPNKFTGQKGIGVWRTDLNEDGNCKYFEKKNAIKQ